jgi:hypothetical protein
MGLRPTFGGITQMYLLGREIRHRGTRNCPCGRAGILWPVMLTVTNVATEMYCLSKHQTHLHTAHATHGSYYLVGWPLRKTLAPTSTNGLHKLHYGVLSGFTCFLSTYLWWENGSTDGQFSWMSASWVPLESTRERSQSNITLSRRFECLQVDGKLTVSLALA